MREVDYTFLLTADRVITRLEGAIHAHQGNEFPDDTGIINCIEMCIIPRNGMYNMYYSVYNNTEICRVNKPIRYSSKYLDNVEQTYRGRTACVNGEYVGLGVEDRILSFDGESMSKYTFSYCPTISEGKVLSLLNHKKTFITISSEGYDIRIDRFLSSELYSCVPKITTIDVDGEANAIIITPRDLFTYEDADDVWFDVDKVGAGTYLYLRNSVRKYFNRDFSICENSGLKAGYSLIVNNNKVDNLSEERRRCIRKIMECCLSKINKPIHEIVVCIDSTHNGLFFRDIKSGKYKGEYKVLLALRK